MFSEFVAIDNFIVDTRALIAFIFMYQLGKGGLSHIRW